MFVWSQGLRKQNVDKVLHNRQFCQFWKTKSNVNVFQKKFIFKNEFGYVSYQNDEFERKYLRLAQNVNGVMKCHIW